MEQLNLIETRVQSLRAKLRLVSVTESLQESVIRDLTEQVGRVKTAQTDLDKTLDIITERLIKLSQELQEAVEEKNVIDVTDESGYGQYLVRLQSEVDEKKYDTTETLNRVDSILGLLESSDMKNIETYDRLKRIQSILKSGIK